MDSPRPPDLKRASPDPTDLPPAKRPKSTPSEGPSEPEPTSSPPVEEQQPTATDEVTVIGTQGREVSEVSEEVFSPLPSCESPESEGSIIPMGYILTASHEFTDDTVTVVAGLERVKFVIHRHLVPWTITENMSSMQAAIVEEILIPNQHPDTIGMMVNWCYRKTVPSVLPHLLANPYSVEEVPDIPNLLPPRQLDQESDQDGFYVQHQVLTECLGGSGAAGATRDVSFEEFRLTKYNEMVDPAIRRSQATYQNTEEMEEAEDTLLEVEGPSEKAIRDAMTKYLQEEGVPVFEASEGRVEAEILQIKLVRLAMLATKYRWKRLLDDTLLAYAKGKTLFARRFPVPRHIELAYSVSRGLPRLRIFMANYAAALTKEYNTDVELLSLHGRCPGFFRDNMMRHTRSPPSRLSDPIAISHYEV